MHTHTKTHSQRHIHTFVMPRSSLRLTTHRKGYTEKRGTFSQSQYITMTCFLSMASIRLALLYYIRKIRAIKRIGSRQICIDVFYIPYENLRTHKSNF